MKNNTFTFKKGITHSGVFHADEVFGSALVQLINPQIEITRTVRVTDEEKNDPESIVFDIGFGKFDHHQADGEVRENGIKYAAFGLLWREYGEALVPNKGARDKLDETFVQFIDAQDNGGAANPLSAAIAAFNPNWDEEATSDDQFAKATAFATEVLQRVIAKANAEVKAENLVREALDSSENNIVILEKFIPWQQVLVPSTAEFVVFPSLRGGWSAQAVPTQIGATDQKIPFPAEWAGKPAAELSQKLSGLTFCHPGRFMIGADTREQAIEACRIAQSNNK